MLKKLRRKIIWINMTLVSLVLLAAVALLFRVTVQTASNSLYYSLFYEISQMDSEHEQNTTQLGKQERQRYNTLSIPHVKAILQDDGTWEVQSADNISIDPETLQEALARVERSSKKMGTMMDLRLVYVQRDLSDYTVVALGDTFLVRYALYRSLGISVLVFLLGLVIFFFISHWLSRMAVKPIDDAWRQQKQFIADASHELKTPLTVILANSNIMSTHQLETVAQQAQWLESTREEAAQMQALIDEMLTLAKSEDDRVTPTLQPTNLSDLVEETILFLEPVAYERGVSLDSHIPRDQIWQTDPNLMQKLTAILVDNAVKHGSPNSQVTVTLSVGRTAILSVHNYGTPIAPEDLPHLFDRFYRSDKSRSTEGHGLGLAIAQSIAQKLHGKLTVTSSEKAGTTFTAEFR